MHFKLLAFSPGWGRVCTGSRSSASHLCLSTRMKSSGMVWSTFLGFSHFYLAWVGPQGGVNLVGLGRFQVPGADDGQASRRPTFLVLCGFQGHTSVKENDFHFSFFFFYPDLRESLTSGKTTQRKTQGTGFSKGIPWCGFSFMWLLLSTSAGVIVKMRILLDTVLLATR